MPEFIGFIGLMTVVVIRHRWREFAGRVMGQLDLTRALAWRALALGAWRLSRTLEAVSWAAERRFVTDAVAAGYQVRSLVDLDTGRRELAVIIRRG